MKKYTEIQVGGETVKKHRRDIRKDAIITSFIPDRPCSIFESSAGTAILSRQLKDEGHDVTISNYYLQNFANIKEIHQDLNKNVDLPQLRHNFLRLRSPVRHL